MKKIIISILYLFSLSLVVAAQKSISDLVPAHVSALQKFLTSHTNLDFMSERSIDPEYLKSMREYLGVRFTPFYQKGDFNGDGRQDFAVILAREGSPEDQGPNMAETHRYRYPVTIVIFNGTTRGAYRPVFIKNITAPLVCLLKTTGGRKKKLYFGVNETDEGFTMRPARKGYIIVEH